MKRALLVLQVLLGHTLAAAAQPADPHGEWIIRRNGLAPSPVQAYYENDRSLLGRHFVLTKDKVYFTGSTPVLEDQCAIARIEFVSADDFDIICRDGKKFGPPNDRPTFHMAGNALVVRWYDNLILHLRRSARSDRRR